MSFHCYERTLLGWVLDNLVLQWTWTKKIVDQRKIWIVLSSTSFDDTIGDWVIELLYIDFKNATWQ